MPLGVVSSSQITVLILGMACPPGLAVSGIQGTCKFGTMDHHCTLSLRRGLLYLKGQIHRKEAGMELPSRQFSLKS